MGDVVRVSLTVTGSSREEVFAALSDVERFPQWAVGLKGARVLEPSPDGLSPGNDLEFILSAAGVTHNVTTTMTAVEPPRLLWWCYTEGASGSGGWILEDEGRAVKITFETSYEIDPRWLDRLAGRPFFKGITQDLLRRSMRRFGERLSGGHAPTVALYR
jgi:uncharacterized protein YndB with AHSA1/START domain